MTPGVYGLRLLRSRQHQGAALTLIVAIVVGFRVFQLAVLSGEPKWAWDLSFYWEAGRRLVEGLSIYSADQLAGPYVPEGQDGFLYPPAFAVAFAPLTIPFADGYWELSWLWLALGVAILAASVAAIVRVERLDEALLGNRRFAIPWFVAASLVLPPVIGELEIGNVHLELLGLYSVAWLGLRRGDATGDRVAGLAIAAATIIKIFPGLVILWFLGSRRWRPALWALAGIVGLMVVSLPAVGIQAWFDYVRVLVNMGAIVTSHDSVAPTVWIAPAIGFTAARMVILAAGVGLVVYAARARPPVVGYAMAVTVSVLIAPAVFHHYLSVLVLPLLLALSAGVRPVLVAVVYFLLWGGQQPALGDWAWALSRVPQTIGWAALLIVLATVRPWRKPPYGALVQPTRESVAT